MVGLDLERELKYEAERFNYLMLSLSADAERFMKLLEDVERNPGLALSVALSEKIPEPKAVSLEGEEAIERLKATLEAIEKAEKAKGRRLTPAEIRELFIKGRVPRALRGFEEVVARGGSRAGWRTLKWAIRIARFARVAGAANAYGWLLTILINIVAFLFLKYVWMPHEMRQMREYPLSSAISDLEDLIKRLEYDLKEDPSLVLRTIPEIRATLDEYERILEERKSEFEKVGTYETHKTRIRLLRTWLSKLESEATKYSQAKREAIDEPKVEAKKWMAMAKSYEERIRIKRGELDRKKLELSRYRDDLSTLESRLEEIKTKLAPDSELMRDKRRYEDALDRIALEKAELRRKISEAIRREDWAKVEELRGRLERIEAEERKYRDKLYDINEEIDRLKDEKSRIETQISTLKDRIARLEGEIKTLEAEIKDLESKKEMAEAMATAANVTAETAEAMAKDLNTSLAEAYTDTVKKAEKIIKAISYMPPPSV